MRRLGIVVGVLLALVGAVGPARAQDRIDIDALRIDEAAYVDGNRWRASGQGNDEDCRPPHRLAVSDAAGVDGLSGVDVENATTVARLPEGAWDVEFESSFEEIILILYCYEVHIDKEVSRHLWRVTRDEAAPPLPRAGRRSAGGGGVPVAAVAGAGSALALAAAAGALVMRARRPARQDKTAGHARCVARHAAAREGAAQALTPSVELDQAVHAAREAFDDLLGQEGTIEAVVDDYVRRNR